MCGLVGMVLGRAGISGSIEQAIAQMTAALIHRGPDDHGHWIDRENGIAMGHRRLSIIDTSVLGRQPMHSGSGRYSVVYNGEAYNFRHLREQLLAQGVAFKGRSDTEVVVAAIENWGLMRAVRALEGMFALACWDAKERRLWLARDRFGEKPLYYGWINNVFAYASELKALTRLPGWNAEIDRRALSLYMRHGYVPQPYSIYKNIFKLPPASVLGLSEEHLREPQAYQPYAEGPPQLIPQQYWQLGADQGDAGGAGDGGFEELLRGAVARQMVADVPLGAFLSGGIDSSTIVALMQSLSAEKVHTFSIGFSESQYDEARYAKKISQHLGTDHTELYVSPDDALAVVPELPGIYDEPFADSSQIPTILVSRLARSKVTVALSGDGGDELFGGYQRYRWCHKLWRMREVAPDRLPALLNSRGAKRAIKSLGRVTPEKYSRALIKLDRFATLMTLPTYRELYRELLSFWRTHEAVVKNTLEPTYVLTDPARCNEQDMLKTLMCLDIHSYLPDDILVKVDRASMAFGLEVRVPFLDRRVAEFAWRDGASSRTSGPTKVLVRNVLRKYVPEGLFERPKQGFAIPIGEWLRGPLREWADALLDEASLEGAGYFDARLITAKWNEHKRGIADWRYPLWNVLMFQSWAEQGAH